MKHSLLLFFAIAALTACGASGTPDTTPTLAESGSARYDASSISYTSARAHVKLQSGMMIPLASLLATNVINNCGGGEAGSGNAPTPPPNNMAQLNIVVPDIASRSGTKMTVEETTALPSTIPLDLDAGSDVNGETTIAVLMTVNHPVTTTQPWTFQFASDCWFCQSNFSVYSSATGAWDDYNTAIAGGGNAPMAAQTITYLGSDLATLAPKQTYIFAVFPYLGRACN